MFKLPKFLFSPNDSASPVIGAPNPQSKEDVIDFLGADDDKDEPLDLTPKKDDKKAKEDDDTEGESKTRKGKDKDDKDDDDEGKDLNIIDDEDELEALLNEEKGPTEEQLELTTPVRRREILKKYPNVFKDFPYLEKAYYREQQFTEVFPTIDEAKEAVAKSKTLDTFEQELMSGKTDNILSAVKDQDPNTFYKLVDDYLPTLARVDEKAFLHVVGNVTKHTIIAMLTEAKKSNNETLQAAAQILNQFSFGSSDFKPPSNLAKDVPKQEEGKVNEVDRREREFLSRQFETTRGELNTKVENVLKSTISAHIDPKDSMPEYVKKNAVRDANEKLTQLLDKDARFRTILDKLWEDVFKKNFSSESVARVKSAYLSKAKTLLPAVIKQARNEALKGIGRKVREEKDDDGDEKPSRKSESRSNDRSDKDKSNKVPRKMSTLEFLNSD